MSDTVKVSSALPADEQRNGLDALAPTLLENPSLPQMAMVVFDVVKVVERPDDQTRVPYIRFRAFHPLGPSKEMPKRLQTMIEKAVYERTGVKPLPFDSDFEVHPEEMAAADPDAEPEPDEPEDL